MPRRLHAQDLVTFDGKHNDANGEGNRDGTDDNRSWNCGVEGETDDPEINALRDRQIRNVLATLLLSQGTPMLLAGDELRNTQGGNNNAYCQDNAISWLDWERDDRADGLHEFTKRLLRLRGSHPVFRRAEFLTGEERMGSGAPDVWWFRPDGGRMTRADWDRGDAFALGVMLNGSEIPSVTPHGRGDRGRVVHHPLQRLAGARDLRAPTDALRSPLGSRALDRRA